MNINNKLLCASISTILKCRTDTVLKVLSNKYKIEHNVHEIRVLYLRTNFNHNRIKRILQNYTTYFIFVHIIYLYIYKLFFFINSWVYNICVKFKFNKSKEFYRKKKQKIIDFFLHWYGKIKCFVTIKRLKYDI